MFRPHPDLTLDGEALDEIVAGADYIGRSGASNLDVNYNHEDLPPDLAEWYATASYPLVGMTALAEGFSGPEEAIRALVIRVLTGASCAGCGSIMEAEGGPPAPDEDRLYPGGRIIGAAASRGTLRCRWSRKGSRWVSGCGLADA